jgi:hypothetical protein
MEYDNNFKIILFNCIKNLKENDLLECAISHLLTFVGSNFAGFERLFL